MTYFARFAPLTAVFFLAWGVSLAVAGESVNTDKTGLALRGYDPVAYFTQNAAVEGNYQFVSKFDGASYWFANEANKQTFDKDPAKYVPQFGGYCALGVSVGRKFPADPKVFTINGGKLYINVNEAVGKKFDKDTAEYVKKAESNWPAIKDVPAGEIR
jgi:YHS domain-containing protein